VSLDKATLVYNKCMELEIFKIINYQRSDFAVAVNPNCSLKNAPSEVTMSIILQRRKVQNLTPNLMLTRSAVLLLLLPLGKAKSSGWTGLEFLPNLIDLNNSKICSNNVPLEKGRKPVAVAVVVVRRGSTDRLHLVSIKPATSPVLKRLPSTVTLRIPPIHPLSC
jgi:hypothetical protein